MLTHISVALGLQAVIGLLTGNWWAGAAAGAFCYLGREVAQAEYRTILANYGGKRANMPWYGGFEPRAWTRKGLIDWVVPALAVTLVALCVYLWMGS